MLQNIDVFPLQMCPEVIGQLSLIGTCMAYLISGISLLQITYCASGQILSKYDIYCLDA